MIDYTLNYKCNYKPDPIPRLQNIYEYKDGDKFKPKTYNYYYDIKGGQIEYHPYRRTVIDNFKNPNFIKQASEIFGSSTIVIGIEAIKSPDGKYYAYTDNAREYTGVEVLYWAKEVERLGAGEILLTSVDNEGMGKGFDLDLIRKVTELVNIPVIAHGGCGNVNHIESAISIGGASAVAIASLLHYNAIKSVKSSKVEASEGNKQFLNSNKNYLNFQDISISEIKRTLNSKKIPCRLNIDLGEKI
jgi:cyclase